MKNRITFATTHSRILAAIGVLSLGFVPNAQALCGGVPSLLTDPNGSPMQHAGAKLVRTADEDGSKEHPSIIGMWHVKFVSDGISSGIPGGIPKGAVIDAGYSTWNQGGTEITNSGSHAPNTSSFCLGVWEQVGPRKYKLNHFAIPWDPTKGPLDSAGNPVGEILGPAQIKESVTLAANGESFAGPFTIDQYDEDNHHLAHLQGEITATRIDLSTGPSSVF